ncbi:hypothetical protein GCM10020331_030830 [Ectobacillus funiculus]
MRMAPRIRKVKVVNNNGSINFWKPGLFCTFFSVSKEYNGSGGDSTGVIVNGRRTENPAVGTSQNEMEDTDLQQEQEQESLPEFLSTRRKYGSIY